ncbi:PEP-CTERM sorting domain-containing protein [Aliiglaciecola litoralis]|uniref:Ice-binding protein C-terminal domain-containing protein n=1 Tax=Aliiglaciecola litoralis TaxID=582857 RepID=A0ABN1LQM5_9ALTE
MKTISSLRILLLITFLIPFSSNAGLIVSGGQLIGATDVEIDGTLFDVTFFEGTCEDAWTGCDESGDFLWQSQADAELAGNALIEQVFINGVMGNFGTQPELTFGCENTSYCWIVNAFWNGSGVLNIDVNLNTNENSLAGPYFDPCSDCRDDLTYAIWTEAVNEVPEPATLSLFALALLFLHRIRKA